MKKLLKLGTLFAAVCSLALFTAGCKKAAEQPKPEPAVKTVTRENIHGVMALDDKNIWVVGNYGVIYYTSDYGKTWTQQASGVDTLLIDGVFLNPTTGWVVGVNGTVLHTTNGGKTWTRQKTGTDKHLFGICFVNEKLGWVVGEMGLILHTADGGSTWTAQGQEQDKALNNIAFVNDTTGVAVGETGTMLRTVDGGKTWSPVQPKIFDRASIDEEIERPRQTLFGIVAKDASTFVACGIDSLFLYSSDAGQTWESFTADKIAGVYSLFLKGNTGWAVGDRGYLFTSNDGGKSWQWQPGAIKTGWFLRDVAFTSPARGIAVGSTDTIVLTNDGGKTWDFRSGIYYTVKGFPVPKYVGDTLFPLFAKFAGVWHKSLPDHY